MQRTDAAKLETMTMRTLTLIALTWSLVVGAAVAAKAEDSAVLAPTGCNLPVSNIVRVHDVLCKGDAVCTQSVVDSICELSSLNMGVGK
jgi:hypothetical protein